MQTTAFSMSYRETAAGKAWIGTANEVPLDYE
jgi:hypothetical protein